MEYWKIVGFLGSVYIFNVVNIKGDFAFSVETGLFSIYCFKRIVEGFIFQKRVRNEWNIFKVSV